MRVLKEVKLQICFHCSSPIQDDVKAYQDGNTFPETIEYYSGQQESKNYRWVCPECEENEKTWFYGLMNERLQKWLRNEEMLEND